MGPAEFSKVLNEYGLIAILASLLIAIGYSWRHTMKVLLDQDKGLIITGHRELVESIRLNRESNRINADANAVNARANERHARSHERTSRVLEGLARRLDAQDILDAAGDDDSNDGEKTV